MATNNFAGHDRPPYSPRFMHHALIPPFIKGNGINFSQVSIFYYGSSLHVGSIIKTDKQDLLRVMSICKIEDLFEDISGAICLLITNNPNDIIDITAREFSYQFSAYAQS